MLSMHASNAYVCKTKFEQRDKGLRGPTFISIVDIAVRCIAHNKTHSSTISNISVDSAL